LAAAAFMIRDGNMPGENITVLEMASILGGSLDGAGDPAGGYPPSSPHYIGNVLPMQFYPPLKDSF